MQFAMPPYMQHKSEESEQEKAPPQELSAPVQHVWQSKSFEHACTSAEQTSGIQA